MHQRLHQKLSLLHHEANVERFVLQRQSRHQGMHNKRKLSRGYSERSDIEGPANAGYAMVFGAESVIAGP